MQPNWVFPLPQLLSRPRTSHLDCQNSLLTNFLACWFPCPPPTPGQSCLLNALLEVGCGAGPAVVNQPSCLSWIALAYLPPQPTLCTELSRSRFFPTCCFLQPVLGKLPTAFPAASVRSLPSHSVSHPFNSSYLVPRCQALC